MIIIPAMWRRAYWRVCRKNPASSPNATAISRTNETPLASRSLPLIPSPWRRAYWRVSCNAQPAPQTPPPLPNQRNATCFTLAATSTASVEASLLASALQCPATLPQKNTTKKWQ